MFPLFMCCVWLVEEVEEVEEMGGREELMGAGAGVLEIMQFKVFLLLRVKHLLFCPELQVWEAREAREARAQCLAERVGIL